MSQINWIPGLFTDADLSSNQYRAVRLNDENEVTTISNANAPQIPLGIQQDDPDGSSIRAPVAVAGPGSICYAEYGGSVTAGNKLGMNNSGQLIAAAFESAIGTADLYVFADALEDGASGEIHRVFVQTPVPGSTE